MLRTKKPLKAMWVEKIKRMKSEEMPLDYLGVRARTSKQGGFDVRIPIHAGKSFDNLFEERHGKTYKSLQSPRNSQGRCLPVRSGSLSNLLIAHLAKVVHRNNTSQVTQTNKHQPQRLLDEHWERYLFFIKDNTNRY